MNAGFFWKVPNTEHRYLYTDAKSQTFLEANFNERPKRDALEQWDSLPIPDKIALLLIQEGELDHGHKDPDE